jgi:hypothetical protein
MPAEINYKKKYLELRSKYMGDIDIAFRLGVEQGLQQAQQQQAQEAEARADQKEMQMQQMSMQADGQDGSEGAEPSEEGAPDSGEGGIPGPGPEQAGSQPPGMGDQTQGSELDGHISKLEGMLGSGADPEVKKSLEAILSLRKAEKQAIELKKSQAAISGIAKALHKPAFKMSAQASHNLNDNAKRAVSTQHKIVTDIMKAWKEEESKAEKSIDNILNVEGLLNNNK